MTLANTERPRTFAELLGQTAAKKTIMRIGAAGKRENFLLEGPRGTGKTSTARLIAKAYNCLSLSPEGEVCGVCENCLALDEGRYTDYIEIDGASNGKIDELREIMSRIGYACSMPKGKFKVVVIDECHRVTGPAFDASLKSLEEPPDHVVFILATTEPHKVPLTIQSRCKRFSFGKVPPETVGARIKQIVSSLGMTIEDAAVKCLIKKADGGMRDCMQDLERLLQVTEDGNITLDLAREHLGILSSFHLAAFVNAAYKDPVEAISKINEIANSGVSLTSFTDQLLSFLHSVLTVRLAKEKAVEILELDKDDYMVLSALDADLGGPKLLKGIDEISRALSQMKYAAKPDVILTASVARLCLPDLDQEERIVAAVVERISGMLQGARPVPVATAVSTAAPPVQVKATVREEKLVGAPGPTAPIIRPVAPPPGPAKNPVPAGNAVFGMANSGVSAPASPAPFDPNAAYAQLSTTEANKATSGFTGIDELGTPCEFLPEELPSEWLDTIAAPEAAALQPAPAVTRPPAQPVPPPTPAQPALSVPQAPTVPPVPQPIARVNPPANIVRPQAPGVAGAIQRQPGSGTLTREMVVARWEDIKKAASGLANDPKLYGILNGATIRKVEFDGTANQVFLEFVYKFHSTQATNYLAVIQQVFINTFNCSVQVVVLCNAA